MNEEKFSRPSLLCDNIFLRSPFGFIIFDKFGKLVRCNPAFVEIFGSSPDEERDFTSSTLLKHLGFYDQLSALNPKEILQFSDIWLQTEHIFTTATPKNICVSCLVFGVFSTAGQVENYVIEIIDRTDQMVAEDLLFESEKRYQQILEQVSEVILTVNLNNQTISSLNKPAQELFGWPENDLLGTNAFTVVSPKYHNIGRELIQKVSNNQIPTDPIEMEFLTHGGHTFHAKINLQVICFNNQPSELILFLKNILSTPESSSFSADHDKRLESIGNLAGGIAHDFNNILAALLGNVTYALEQNDLAVVKSILTETEQTIHRGQNLSYQLLTFAKGGQPVKKQTDLTPLIANTAIHTLRSSRSRCTLDFDEILWEVDVDAHQISQALGNIINNADEAMEHGGNIFLSFHNRQFSTMHKVEESALPHFIVPPGKYIEITIRDEGTGISTDIREKVFEPYFSTKGIGAGLGLATVYSIVRNHGGYLTFTTRLSGSQQGTTFFLYLPVISPNNASSSIDTASIGGSEGQPKKPHIILKEKILVLEDEPAIIKILDKMLRHMKLQPTFTLNGSETIEEYKNAMENDQGFNLVLIDLTIPGGLGGKDTIIVLQKLDPDVKAIVSSGYSNNPIMSRPKEYGFQDVLKKPFTLRELREIIMKYL